MHEANNSKGREVEYEFKKLLVNNAVFLFHLQKFLALYNFQNSRSFLIVHLSFNFCECLLPSLNQCVVSFLTSGWLHAFTFYDRPKISGDLTDDNEGVFSYGGPTCFYFWAKSQLYQLIKQLVIAD